MNQLPIDTQIQLVEDVSHVKAVLDEMKRSEKDHDKRVADLLADHEKRVRSLERLRNWVSGLGAAGAALWALIHKG